MATTKLSYRFWAILAPAPVLFITTLFIFFYHQSKTEDKVMCSLFLVVFTAIAVYHLRFIRRYRIYVENSTISVENYFSKSINTYFFSDFDMVVSSWENRHRGGPVQVLSFKRNEEVILRLSGDYYKNVDEIKSLLLYRITIKNEPRKLLVWDKITIWIRKKLA